MDNDCPTSDSISTAEERRLELEHARERLRPYLGGPSMADELIRERRAEAMAEETSLSPVAPRKES